MSETMDEETKSIAEECLLATVGSQFFGIVERDGAWWVLQHTQESVFPQVSYPTKRDAAGRMLQLLHVGPVAPQTHPEIAGISQVLLQSILQSKEEGEGR